MIALLFTALVAVQPADVQFLPHKATCAYAPGSNVIVSAPAAYSPSTGEYYFMIDETPTTIADSGFVDARASSWYRNYEDVSLNGETYSRYGLPRIVGADEVVFYAEYQGGPLLAEPGAGDRPDILYALTGPMDCEVQALQRND